MPSFKDLLENDPLFQAIVDVHEGKKKAPVTDKEDDGEGMDPVGKEDGDIDNDGDSDKSDKYLKNRRKEIGKAIAKEDVDKKDETMSGDDEKGDKEEAPKPKKKKKDVKKQDAPKQDEAPASVKDKGAEVVDTEPTLDESDAAYARALEKEKEGRLTPSDREKLGKIRDMMRKEREKKKRLGEAEMTPDQEKKREEIVLSLKKKKADFVKKYGDRADDVMYATATKMAMKSEGSCGSMNASYKKKNK